MTENSITLHAGGGMSFVGPMAVEIFQATTVKVALESYAKNRLIMNRSLTLSNMLRYAQQRTQGIYPRSARGARQASADLSTWIEARRAEIQKLANLQPTLGY